MASLTAFKKANAWMNVHATDLRQGPSNFHVHYWGFMPKHYSNSVHRHSFFEICYVLEGNGAYSDSGNDYPLRAGSAICSRPGAWHQIRSEDGMALLFVAFDIDEETTRADYAKAFRRLAQDGVPCLDSVCLTPAAKLWEVLLAMCEQEPLRYPAEVLQNVSHSLLSSFLPLFMPDATEVPVESAFADIRRRPGSELFQRARLYIEDNLEAGLTLENIAQHLHVSPRHLSRLVMEECGQTLIHYVQERRIRRAQQLLLSTNAAIKEIAEQCGFESVHYFTRVFSRKLGVPPARFRRSGFAEGRSDSVR
ncbi:AraC family transcriptional regulator [Saccharibacillus qingshengii]|uniref:AraC family transcriptional regulator n=1 Tax=Saccharibacillus qingshengii TaxID=1763540 RepID=UPI0015550D76|nr:AraC family transcriptional regulator [Saccharibacillus qingshengii]